MVTYWRIVGRGICAGLSVCDGVVVDSAPILRWTRGKRWSFVRANLASRGFHGAVLPDDLET